MAITLSRYDLSVWDVVTQSWVLPQGAIGFSVGASSRDFRLAGTVPIPGAGSGQRRMARVRRDSEL